METGLKEKISELKKEKLIYTWQIYSIWNKIFN